jgi:hypothetical protein
LNELIISSLNHTWILDLDGTLVKHNGYKDDGHDTLLDGAAEFLRDIPDGDMIVIITSRTDEYRAETERFLRENDIRYDHIIYNAPYGERIIVNDRKPSGLATAVAVNTERDNFYGIALNITDAI